MVTPFSAINWNELVEINEIDLSLLEPGTIMAERGLRRRCCGNCQNWFTECHWSWGFICCLIGCTTLCGRNGGRNKWPFIYCTTTDRTWIVTIMKLKSSMKPIFTITRKWRFVQWCSLHLHQWSYHEVLYCKCCITMMKQLKYWVQQLIQLIPLNMICKRNLVRVFSQYSSILTISSSTTTIQTFHFFSIQMHKLRWK